VRLGQSTLRSSRCSKASCQDNGELVAWSDYAGLAFDSHQGIWLRLFRAKGDKRTVAVRVKVSQLHSWVIPPVVEAHARRYGGASLG